jgi:hypothetical protein
MLESGKNKIIRQDTFHLGKKTIYIRFKRNGDVHPHQYSI